MRIYLVSYQLTDSFITNLNNSFQKTLKFNPVNKAVKLKNYFNTNKFIFRTYYFVLYNKQKKYTNHEINDFNITQVHN